MFLDPLYLIILSVVGGLSFIASLFVKINFAKGSKIAISSSLSGAEVAKKILQANQIDDVKIKEGNGFLTDHYNPVTKELVLSKDIYNGKNAAAAGIAAHEVGHAIQHANRYFPMWLRSFLVPITNIGSTLGIWITVIGIGMGSVAEASKNIFGTASIIAVIGIALFSFAFIFSVVTLPVEINASSRALKSLSSANIITSNSEKRAIKNILTAAALTYLVAAISSLLQLIYWIIKSGLLSRRD